MLQARFPGAQVLFFDEGLESSVTVIRDTDGYLTLFTNSRGQSRDEPGLLSFHRLVGHLPASLHPEPKKALIVGMGAGSTAGAILQQPSIERIDVAELSDGVIDAVRYFGHSNYAFFEDPRVDIRQTDARNHLLLTDTKYDVVAGDAIRPNDAGSATLYSVEYFKLVANALEDDGLMALWLPPFSDYQYKLILRTFLEAFPYATLWQSGDLLIGSKQPLKVDVNALERRMQDPALRAALGEIFMTSPAGMLGKFQAGPDELRAYVGEGPIITDDRPYIEYFRSLPKDGGPYVNFSRNSEPIILRR
jgi:spermidine synthase